MTDRNSELDEILQPLKTLQPRVDQIQRWKNLRKKPQKIKLNLNHVMQLAAACFVGFMVGFFFKAQEAKVSEVSLNIDSSATIEVVYNKSE
ncbi:MAG: hypothetical protein J0M15_04305 [Deltaproteobacteria bacterium]|jgi:hypothetical protein|nr:hypothetical protein [Deltaproteobacteria bacterium]